MKESILHFVWQYRLFEMQKMQTTEGVCVDVIDVGRLNADAGPDFFNAKVKIGDTVWAGNIEIHNFSSDWTRHGHEENKAYDNVILHIVRKADKDIFRTNGIKIPQLELEIPDYILKNYEDLSASQKWIYCEDKITEVPSIFINSWKNALLIERLERKLQEIENLLSQSNNHWEEAFYVLLARNFGFGTNSQAFEQTAKSLPLRVLAKHKDNLFQLEALLLGQAGFLDKSEDDTYQSELQREYLFLQTKYRLTPIDSSQWKLLRLRPDNFPHIRLAQFAVLIHRSTKLFSKILNLDNAKDLRALFTCEVSDYWQKHYLFGRESKFSKKKLGKSSIDIIIINTVVPFLFSYYKKKNQENELPITLLEAIPPEHNSIITNWKRLGLIVENAFDTQAFIQLKREYCENKKCLQCRIGHRVLKTTPQTN